MSELLGVATPPPLVLRRWQAEAIPLALDDIEARIPGVIIAATGGGKSIALAELIRRYRLTHPDSEGRIVVTTPSKKLVNQLSATFASVLGAHLVGRYYTGAKQWQRPVIVCCNASILTLSTVLSAQSIPVALWIADECHKTESDRIIVSPADADAEGDNADLDPSAFGDILRAHRRFGFTATPFRSREEERLSLFKKKTYVYPPAAALRDGVIVPWRIIGWDEDEAESDPDIVVATMIQRLGSRAERGPGVVNASSIEDAERYCAFLADRNIVARPIHSKMSQAVQDQNIDALRAGEIDCLVHVSMLVEGVDFPWLRWGGLRRPVGARIRFIQEVGRFIRACPEIGKTEAILLDPHDLFGTFQLTYEASLGWEEPEEDDEDPIVRRERKEIEDADEKEPKERRVARTAALARYVRQLYIALLAEGRVPSAKTFGAASASWRLDSPSPAQVTLLRRVAKSAIGSLAEPHRAAIGKVAASADIANKGIVSDALSLLSGLRDAKIATWEPASPVPLPPAPSFEAVALPPDVRFYVAGGMRGTLAAAAVVHKGRVIEQAVRERQPGDTWTTLALWGVARAVRFHGATEVVVSDADTARVLTGERRPTKNGERFMPYIPPRLAVSVEPTNPAARVVWKSLPRPAPTSEEPS